VAHCLILAQLLDENVWTLALVFFVPGGDIFYFITRFWQYFKWFCVEYVGAAVWAGAALGLAAHGAH
jgi:prolipoprotein diacylglyceryltransferase